MTTTPAATLVVVVPLTDDDCLGQNARCHHFARARQAKALRTAARLATVSVINGGASIPELEERVALTWTVFLAKGRKQRDADNMIGVLKPAQDGMCEALGLDDAQIVLRGVVQCLTTARQSEAVAELTAGGTT